MSGAISVPHLKALVERMGVLDNTILGGFYPKVRPLITIEQFFKGSNGQASMWHNQVLRRTIDEPAFWKQLRDRSDVWDVLISLRQYDFYDKPYSETGEWVHSDVVVVITSAASGTIRSWFDDDIAPEIIEFKWGEEGEPCEAVFVPSGMKSFICWYD